MTDLHPCQLVSECPDLLGVQAKDFAVLAFAKKHGFWMTEITSKSAEGNSLFTNAVLMILTCVVNNRHQDLSHGFPLRQTIQPKTLCRSLQELGKFALAFLETNASDLQTRSDEKMLIAQIA